MKVLADLGVVVLAGTVHAALQLGLGGLLLLYHASMGRHVNRKTRALVGSYVAGVGMLILMALPAMAFLIGAVFNGEMGRDALVWIVSILLMFAILIWLFYYRRGSGTELWLPKAVARFVDRRAKATNSNVEAFSLGMVTAFMEAPFTILLFLVAGNSLVEMPLKYQCLAIAVYTILAILPLVIMRVAIKSGRTVVEIQKWRIKHKNFLKVILGLGFLVLGGFLLAYKAAGVMR